MQCDSKKVALFKSIFWPAYSGAIGQVTFRAAGNMVGAVCLVVVLSGMAVIAGCKAGVNEVVKDSDTVVFDQSGDKTVKGPIKAEPVGDQPSEDKTKRKEKELIRVQKAEPTVGGPEVKKENTEKTSGGSAAPKPLKPAGTSSRKEAARPKPYNIPEIDRVKEAAREIAKNIDTISKVKICHLKTEDEWWVTLYDDIGSLIDLKQYVWDRESESLTPFLVLKRIPKSRFESHLTAKVPDSACEVFDPPPRPKKKKDEKQIAE